MIETKEERKRRFARDRKRRQRERDSMHELEKGLSSPSSGWQLRPNDGQGVFTSYFNTFIPRKVEASFYEFLREAIPVIDAAINRLVSLDGHIIVKGNNEALVEEIQEWFYNVPVNDIQKGVQAFHQNFTAEAFEQGFVIGEFIVNKKRTDIAGLRVADSKFIKFKRTDTGIDIYQKSDKDIQERLLDLSNLLYFSINNENQNPYGVPQFRSCEFVSKILATMDNSLANVWERFGDPSFSIVYKTSRREGVDFEARRKKIEDEFNTAIRAKREGKSADFVRAIDKDSDIQIDVIGHKGEVLSVDMPARHVIEQIVAKSGLPSWMLGLHWSTTERLSDAEAEMLLADVTTRQAAKMPLFFNLVRTLLLLRGRTWQKGDWWLEWAQVNLRDILKHAQARFMHAQADMYYLQNASLAGIEINISDLAIGKEVRSQKLKVKSQKSEVRNYASCIMHPESCQKELLRPTPWPELDKIEEEYETNLKNKWEDLRQKTFTILGLNNVGAGIALPSAGARSPRPSDNYENKGGGTPPLQKQDFPTIESFTFSDEQRALIMQTMRNWIGAFNIADENSAIRWYYAQSYSLGLIQAVKLIGKEKPILDIIKNSEVYENLIKNGFQLVKDDATKAIINKILPEMEAQMLAGTNPRHVAVRLEKLFGDQNSDWERLARTEMSSAAERAKLDEWGEWGVDKVEFSPAPDACPFCISLAGVYKVGECPIPGTGTHPRCRCSIVPVSLEEKAASSLTEQIAALSEQVKKTSESIPVLIAEAAGRLKTEIIMPEIKFPEIKMPEINLPEINITTPPVNVQAGDLHIHSSKNKGKRKIELKDADGKVIRTAVMEE